MDTLEKLKLLTDAAKYDVACTSSGVNRTSSLHSIGSACSYGICHSYAADGRCISLLKVLLTNYCEYNCQYCVNRRTNDIRRAAFSPRELAELTIQFYRRNYIEGLFLSSAVLKTPDYTTEQMIRVLDLLRHKYHFTGYIHAKAIPGTDPALITHLGYLADRMSVNIELPSQKSLTRLAPDKKKEAILSPMQWIHQQNEHSLMERKQFTSAPSFVPGGQSTQMIIGATPDTDWQILRLTQALYRKYQLKRVFFSAYTPVVDGPFLPSPDTPPPLLREHRLYQADWLLRYYGFKAEELLDEKSPQFHPLLDPKANWAVRHPEFFPIEIMTASYEAILRVPGIGPNSARKILSSRRSSLLSFSHLNKMGVVLKRAQYFITCSGHFFSPFSFTTETVLRNLISTQGARWAQNRFSSMGEQLSLFSEKTNIEEDMVRCLSLPM